MGWRGGEMASDECGEAAGGREAGKEEVMKSQKETAET